VNLDLSDEALEYGRQASRAFEAAGGDELVQRAEREPHLREQLVAPVLEHLGAWELDPHASADDREAAASLCRSAGYWAVAYPLAERLCRPRGSEVGPAVDGQVVVADEMPVGALAGLGGTWLAVSLDGRHSLATPRLLSTPVRKTAFAVELELRPLDAAASADPAGPADPTDIALGLVLPCWTLLGMLDRAMVLTRAYVREREQFGQPLSSFQGVQFQLTDAEVERSGLEALAKYSLWSIGARPDDAIDDALALRAAAIEAADVVFRVTHQLHGAIGFCDETALSWLSRYSQPIRRLPFNLTATRDHLTRRLGRRPLSGLFDAIARPQ
jgi:acyl-CoA dehydrogenase-like protein